MKNIGEWMNNNNKLGTLLTGSFLCLLAVPFAGHADHYWGNYHWARTSNPIDLKLGDNVSSDKWDAYLTTARDDWNMSSVLNTSIEPGGTSPKRCRATSGRVEVCNSRYGNNGWLGIAQIWLSGSHITQAVVKLNDNYFDSATYNTPAWRNLVMCQEVGHTFGLAHQDENFSNANLGTCMDYTSNPASNQHPNSHDYQLMADIYAHTDSFDSYDGSSNDGGNGGNEGGKCRGGPKRCGNQVGTGRPPTVDELVLNEPGQWGRLISESPDKRHAVYELDLGSGYRILTDVFWTEERLHEHDHDH